MHWSTALLGAVPAVVLLLLPLRDTPRGTGYGWTLQRLDSPGLGATVDVFVGLQWMDIAILFLIVVFALGPWLFPSGIAAALPAMVNVTLLAPEPAPVLLIAYLAAAIYARTRLVRVKADLGWEESAAPTSE